MRKAVKGEEIFLSAENKVGLLAQVSTLLSEATINIRALSAYVVEGKAYFRIVTSNNADAKSILKSLGTVQSKEIVIVELPDEIGALADLAELLKDSQIDLHYIYGTTNQPQDSAIIVFSSNNNDKALQAVVS